MSLAQTLALSWSRRSLLGYLLLPLSVLFAGLVFVRRLAYGLGWLKIERLPVPVIVIGNIVVGGSGKTPLTIWLVEQLRRNGYVPGVISRGYGGSVAGVCAVSLTSPAEQVGDEPLLIHRKAACPVFVGRDRPAAARALLATHSECNVIVSDDGLQHYRLGRDIEWVVVDRRALGNGWLLPAGPLREPAGRLGKVDALLLNDCQNPPIGSVPSYAMRLLPQQVRALQGGESCTLAAFSGKRVHAVAGIGEPARFFEMLSASGLEVVRHAFPDHHRFLVDDLAFGDDLPILMTEKDAVKCVGFAGGDVAHGKRGEAKIWVVPVVAEIDPAVLTTVLEKLDGCKTA